MFNELTEEFRPHNLQLPIVRQVGLEEWRELTNDWVSYSGYIASLYANAYFLTAFAEANHVEFVDMLTGRLCLPPEMFLLQLFKRIAKNKGAFVASFQYGFRTTGNWPYKYSPVCTEEFNRKFFSLVRLVHIEGRCSEYDWRQAYQASGARMLGVHKYDASVGVSAMDTTLHALQRAQPAPVMLRNGEEYIIYIPTNEV